MAEAWREPEGVLLGQAGYPVSRVLAQVEQICGSSNFRDQDRLRELLRYLVSEALEGRMPQPETIAKSFGSTGETFARTTTGRVRKRMQEYYANHPKETPHLTLPEGSYLVVAPRNTVEVTTWDDEPTVEIFEPAANSKVSVRVTMRGRIERLDPDLHLWFAVLAPDGWYYLQSRISRRSPTFECQTRTGRVAKVKGSLEGVKFVLLLLAVDFDIDHDFHRAMREFEDAYGTHLPTGTKVLASVQVIRQDSR